MFFGANNVVVCFDRHVVVFIRTRKKECNKIALVVCCQLNVVRSGDHIKPPVVSALSVVVAAAAVALGTVGLVGSTG